MASSIRGDEAETASLLFFVFFKKKNVGARLKAHQRVTTVLRGIFTGSCFGLGLDGPGIFDPDWSKLSPHCNDTIITEKRRREKALFVTQPIIGGASPHFPPNQPPSAEDLI